MDVGLQLLPWWFYWGSAVASSDQIYIIGGLDYNYKDRGNTAYFQAFDGTNFIKTLGNLPYAFYSGGALYYNNAIHIFGGDSYGGNTTAHYKYQNSAWTKISTIPTNFTHSTVVVWKDKFYLFVGTKMYIYSPTTYSWTESSITTPYSVSHSGVVIYNNEVHLLGGSGSASKHYKFNGSSWSEVSTIPYNFAYGCSVIYNNEIHILGGDSLGTNHYKWNGSSWSSVGTLPYGVNQGCAVVFKDELYTLGGNIKDPRTNLYDSLRYFYKIGISCYTKV